ncbi:hypothetical protein SAMN04489764_5096 [Thermostaphylospora chromogena]|uniref:Uncharacterized protein n=2 Tax=Thermostaphylospora chromogena TaxID=35622 RepID=A0A1H1I250_9ACTN|nr:hypothetical protein SAMN04489764_5096 [Thermostaphylospora chromogena]
MRAQILLMRGCDIYMSAPATPTSATTAPPRVRDTAGSTAEDAVLRPVNARLASEFPTVPAETVARRVREARARAEHLGVAATPQVVERVAREHLLALVNSDPATPHR